MTAAQWGGIFANKLFHKVESVGICGGEPTMKRDLPELLGRACQKMPSLHKLSMVTNALNTKRVLESIEEIAKEVSQYDVLFRLGISIDGVGDVHERVRRVPRAFAKVEQTMEGLRELGSRYGFTMGISTTLTPVNLDDAEQMVDYAKSNDMDITFGMIRFADSILGNNDLEGELFFREDQRQQVIDFYSKRVSDSSIWNGDSYLYYNWRKALQNEMQRSMPCPFTDQGLQINPNGDLYYCENSKPLGNCLEQAAHEIYFANANLAYRKGELMKTCDHCQSPCQTLVSARKKVYPYLGYLVNSRLQKWFQQGGASSPPKRLPQS